RGPLGDAPTVRPGVQIHGEQRAPVEDRGQRTSETVRKGSSHKKSERADFKRMHDETGHGDLAPWPVFLTILLRKRIKV
ncbi:MAG: hypothetical protein PUE64_04570, partial [Firmicutes bacterium]|nr:hypothetical protein [Bacillota bacterium]